MSTDALRAAMMDGSDFEIDRLEAAEGALDIGELLVGGNRRGGIEVFGVKVSSHDIDAIEHGLGGDLFALARES
jgi:nitric oxide reductase activation protein